MSSIGSTAYPLQGRSAIGALISRPMMQKTLARMKRQTFTNVHLGGRNTRGIVGSSLTYVIATLWTLAH
jgi:hypothetical protein